MRRRARWPAAWIALLLPLAAAAQGQWSGSLVAASDERFRGRSLTGEHPSLRATLAWDHASGLYGGGSIANASFGGRAQAVLVGYGGASGALGDGLRWDAGLTAWAYPREPEYDYAEASLGVLGERWGLRLSYSPDYYGVGGATLYA
ncbi:MAG: TorF family putative porin, partial [Rubrivivax sp.]